MLKLPPPIWALIYLLIAGAVSWLYPWRVLGDVRVLWLGVALVVIGFIVAASAFSLFVREGTAVVLSDMTFSRIFSQCSKLQGASLPSSKRRLIGSSLVGLLECTTTSNPV